MDSKIDLQAHGDDYLLTQIDGNGTRREMMLSADNIMLLAQSSQRLTSLLRAKQSRPGVSAVVVTPIEKVSLNTDVHLTEIHVGMIDRQDVETWYAMSPALARDLLARLPARVVEVENAHPTRQ